MFMLQMKDFLPEIYLPGNNLSRGIQHFFSAKKDAIANTGLHTTVCIWDIAEEKCAKNACSAA